jgi:hypothetical protein
VATAPHTLAVSMTFKPALWQPIAVVLTVINLIGVAAATMPWHATVHAVLALGFGLWAQRLRQGAGADLGAVRQQMEEQAAALEEAQRMLAGQSTQLAELHERVDFAERVLSQVRDRSALGHREEGG